MVSSGISPGSVSVIFPGWGASFESAISGGLPCCQIGGGAGLSFAYDEANVARHATPTRGFMDSPLSAAHHPPKPAPHIHHPHLHPPRIAGSRPPTQTN